MTTTQPIPEFVPLLKSARPTVYRTNAFRVTGLDIDASPSEIARQIQKLEMMQRLGVETGDCSGLFSLKQKPTIEAIQEARRRLNDPEMRIVDEFFWFWPEGHGEEQGQLWEPNKSSEDPAIQALRRDDIPSAERIWRERQQSDDGDGTATHNLAVLHHLRALDNELSPILLTSTIERVANLTPGQKVATPDGKGSVVAVRGAQVMVRLAKGEANFYDRTQVVISESLDSVRCSECTKLWSDAEGDWERLISEQAFWKKLENRIRLLDDPRVRPTAASSIRSSVPIALATIDVALIIAAAESGNFSVVATHLARVRAYNLPGKRTQELLERATSPLRAKLGELCKRAESEVAAHPESTPEKLKNLLDDTRPIREILNYVLGAGNPARDNAQDQIATVIKQSLPQYGNTTKNYVSCRTLLKEACQLAASSYVRSLCQEDLKTINSLVADQVLDLIVGACKDAEDVVARNPAGAERVIKQLFADTEILFRQLQEATDARSELRVLAYDHVARAARNCVVDFGNASKNWTPCQDLLQQCRSLASSPDLIQRIDEDLGVVQSNLRPIQTGVNFTIPRPQPNQTYVPHAASARSGAGGGAKKIAAVVIGIIVLFALLKFCDTSDTTSSGTSATPTAPASESAPVFSSPPSTTISRPSRDVPNGSTPIPSGANNTPSDTESRVQFLKLQIESGRSQLQQLESSLQECEQTLSNYSRLIEDDRQQLDRMKSDNEAGLYVDENEYERVRARHNSNVDAHNVALGNCREINRRYQSVLNTTNENVDEYNRLITER